MKSDQGRSGGEQASELRFAHSPGRLDPEWLNSLRAFDAAFVLDRGDGTRGIVGVDVKYHERLKAETPKPENLWRYREVHERSGAFRAAAFDTLKGKSALWHLWLEHLLLLSMLQHPSGAWTWATPKDSVVGATKALQFSTAKITTSATTTSRATVRRGMGAP